MKQRKLNKKIKKLELEIATINNEILNIQEQMTKTDNLSDYKKMEELNLHHDELNDKLNVVQKKWDYTFSNLIASDSE